MYRSCRHVGLRLLAVFMLLAWAPGARAAADGPLVLGVLPFVSHVKLFKRYAHLRDYLGERLGRQVVLESARDYPTFLQRSHERRYDILITAPHFALSELDDGHMLALAVFRRPLAAVFMVREDSPLTSLRQLQGGTVATPPATAIITLAGKHHLASLGLEGDKAPRYQTFPSHNAAYHAVLGGEADAAMISPNFLKLIERQKLPLRVLGRSPGFPSMGVLASPKLPASLRQRIAGILERMDRQPEGRAVLQVMNYIGFRRAGRETFEPLRPYLAYLPARDGKAGH